jgi:hypothetical protein
MGGGLLQLVAYGAQDAYIMGNPHITFWKVLYKRHTNFAMEAFRVNFTGAATYGQRVVAVINRNADLMYKTYLQVTLPDRDLSGAASTFNDEQLRYGYNLIDQVELEIGGQIIDRHYGEWMYIWESLTSTREEITKLNYMLSTSKNSLGSSGCKSRPDVLYIPLYFWFCRNPGLALPLIALQYHEVRINITFNAAKFLAPLANSTSNFAPLADAALYIDYVYLDTDERRRFAQESHEYLIEQLQFNEDKTITTANGRIDLTLNHPVKELIWVFQDDKRVDCSITTSSENPSIFGNASVQPFTYDDIVTKARLQVNGQDRFDERYGDYFWKVQPYQHHSGGILNLDNSFPGGFAQTTYAPNPINVYSFALKPEEHQPSGTCNFSRIDTATLVYECAQATSSGSTQQLPSKNYPYHFRLYAVNYNILRIMSGMGGLAYSN